jgi:hypothetical protein
MTASEGFWRVAAQTTTCWSAPPAPAGAPHTATADLCYRVQGSLCAEVGKCSSAVDATCNYCDAEDGGDLQVSLLIFTPLLFLLVLVVGLFYSHTFFGPPSVVVD